MASESKQEAARIAAILRQLDPDRAARGKAWYDDSRAQERQLRKAMWKGNLPGATGDGARRRPARRDYHEQGAERSARKSANNVIRRERPPWEVKEFFADAERFAHRLTPIERSILFLKWGRPGPSPTLAQIARDLGGHDEATVRAAYRRARQECRWIAEVIWPILVKKERRQKLTAEERAAWRKFQSPREGRATVSGMWIEPLEEMPPEQDVGRTAKRKV
jgi:hypothetical protein